MRFAITIQPDIISTHDLTKRSTMWQTYAVSPFAFQLTTSRRGRRSNQLKDARCYVISTHDLTKRSTVDADEPYIPVSISTHDLTKRSTAISYNTTSFKIVFFVLILYF